MQIHVKINKSETQKLNNKELHARTFNCILQSSSVDKKHMHLKAPTLKSKLSFRLSVKCIVAKQGFCLVICLDQLVKVIVADSISFRYECMFLEFLQFYCKNSEYVKSLKNLQIKQSEKEISVFLSRLRPNPVMRSFKPKRSETHLDSR